MADKVMSIDEVVGELRSGMTIGVGVYCIMQPKAAQTGAKAAE